MTPLKIDIEYINFYSVHPFFLFINVTLVKNCIVNALIMYVTYNISYLMLSKEKNNKVNIILRMKVICQALVLMNFALQELKTYFN